MSRVRRGSITKAQVLEAMRAEAARRGKKNITQAIRRHVEAEMRQTIEHDIDWDAWYRDWKDRYARGEFTGG